MGSRDLLRAPLALSVVLALSLTSFVDPGLAQTTGASACPRLGAVDVDERSEYLWLAEADLVPAARLLGRQASTFRPFPGLPTEVDRTQTQIRIVLVRDLSCLSSLGVESPDVDWVAGVAHFDQQLVGLRVEHAGAAIPELSTVLRHELAHHALARASEGRAPRWLQEGYAQLATGSWNWDEAWRLRWFFMRGSGETLERLALRFPRDPAGAQLAYQLSYTAVQELWELSGERGFAAFIRALAAGGTTDDAFRSVFGMTEGQFADRWQETVKSRYGFLYTLSRTALLWTGITFLLLWAGLRRRKIKRERMAKLVEDDRREAAIAAALGLDVDGDIGPV